jgi:intracellular multiplication protein IcmN
VLSRYCIERLSKSLSYVLNQSIWIVFVLLSACQSTPTPSIIRDEAILPEQVARGDAEIITLERRLSERGVQIVSVGQDYLLSISVLSLFGDQSPRLTWAAYDELNEIACYLRQFRKVGVEVTGYASRYVSSEREHALSSARAEAVANYLWSQGIDTRLLFSQGVGDDKPIVMAARARSGDKSPNARIEITFRRTIV